MRCALSSSSVEQCALCADSTHDVHHAIAEVNVVIGVLVVHCELLAVRVVPVVVCDDAVVRRTLVLITFIVTLVFVVSIFRRILLYWRYVVYRCCCVPHLSPLVTIEDVRYYGAMKASQTFFNPVHHVLVGSHQFPCLQTRDSDMMD